MKRREKAERERQKREADGLSGDKDELGKELVGLLRVRVFLKLGTIGSTGEGESVSELFTNIDVRLPRQFYTHFGVL